VTNLSPYLVQRHKAVKVKDLKVKNAGTQMIIRCFSSSKIWPVTSNSNSFYFRNDTLDIPHAVLNLYITSEYAGMQYDHPLFYKFQNLVSHQQF
jgi:hypothetical protein